MRRLRVLLPLLVAALILAALLTSPASATLVLRRSDPADGAQVMRPPAEVFLWFSVPLKPTASLTIFDAEFRNVSRSGAFLDPQDVMLLRLPLQPLAPGRYTVKWSAESRAGEASSGMFDFSVLPPPLPIPLVLAVAGGVAALVISAGVWLLLRWGRRVQPPPY
jgi:hypothetical protein